MQTVPDKSRALGGEIVVNRRVYSVSVDAAVEQVGKQAEYFGAATVRKFAGVHHYSCVQGFGAWNGNYLFARQTDNKPVHKFGSAAYRELAKSRVIIFERRLKMVVYQDTFQVQCFDMFAEILETRNIVEIHTEQQFRICKNLFHSVALFVENGNRFGSMYPAQKFGELIRRNYVNFQSPLAQKISPAQRRAYSIAVGIDVGYYCRPRSGYQQLSQFIKHVKMFVKFVKSFVVCRRCEAYISIEPPHNNKIQFNPATPTFTFLKTVERITESNDIKTMMFIVCSQNITAVKPASVFRLYIIEVRM
jgi:hypothetical protein